MSNKHSRQQKSSSQTRNLSGADDLKLVNGISATLEQRLQRVGVLTYAQLADLTPNDVAKLLGNPDGLKERVVKQDWIGQARQLVESKDRKTPFSDAQGAKAPANDQTYEAFAVELMIGPEREVIHTRVMQVSSGDEEIWGGWQEKRLTDFFVKRADLRLTPTDIQVQQPNGDEAVAVLISETLPPKNNELLKSSITLSKDLPGESADKAAVEAASDTAKETNAIAHAAIEQDQLQT
ncbi:MAG: hypothetical protein ACRD82_01205, partial [Blastocatellia bacterium]